MDLISAVKLAKEGDNQGITYLYEKTYQKSFYIALKYLKNEDSAQDVLQDSYIKAFQSIDQLDDPSKFESWFGRIVATRSLNELKKNNPVLFSETENEDEGDISDTFEDDRIDNCPELAIDQQETARLIHEMMEDLSEEQRMCITMFYMEEMSVKEIAETLGVSENTVKSRLNYGRTKIKDKVLELEKKGTKLYGLLPLVFFFALFKKDAMACERNVPPFTYGAAGEAAVGKTASVSAVKNGIVIAGKTVSLKAVIATVVAAVVIGGGAAGAVSSNNKAKEEARLQAELEAEEAARKAAEEQQAEEEIVEEEPEVVDYAALYEEFMADKNDIKGGQVDMSLTFVTEGNYSTFKPVYSVPDGVFGKALFNEDMNMVTVDFVSNDIAINSYVVDENNEIVLKDTSRLSGLIGFDDCQKIEISAGTINSGKNVVVVEGWDTTVIGDGCTYQMKVFEQTADGTLAVLLDKEMSGSEVFPEDYLTGQINSVLGMNITDTDFENAFWKGNLVSYKNDNITSIGSFYFASEAYEDYLDDNWSAVSGHSEELYSYMDRPGESLYWGKAYIN